MQAIAAERLFNSLTGTIESNRVVIVQDGRILSVESDVGLPAAVAETRIEFADSTLLPGLIDCHVHLAMDGTSQRTIDPVLAAVRAVRGALDTVRSGVTTVRCVGTPGNVDLTIRDAIRDRVIIGPRVVAAGSPIAMTGGHAHTMAIEVDGADAVTAAVRRQVKAGVDVIKLMVTGGVLTPGIRPGTPQLTRDEIATAITIAHRAGRKVCGHAEGTDGVRDAIECGIDSVEHGLFEENDPLLERMKSQGTTLVPTLIAYQAILEGRDALSAESVSNAELAISRNQVSFQRALKAGVVIAMGSDAGTPFNPHGANWRETELMVQLGMSEAQALQASTLVGAELLGLELVGQIAPEHSADMLVVHGNPVEHISDLANVAAVWSRGDFVR
jgi:imidazolonepropionase-like amidohydrolase